MSQATESLFAENHEHFFNSIGQNAKTSQRAYVGRSTLDSRHCSARLARQKSAISGREQSQQDPRLFDHLVGAREQRWRHFEAERFRGLEVDHKLVLCRLLDWYVGGFCAA